MTLRAPFGILGQQVRLPQPPGPTCASLTRGPLAPASRQLPLPRGVAPRSPGGEDSGSRGPTRSFLPSLPPWLPPAGSGTAATSESASLCALSSGRQRGAAQWAAAAAQVAQGAGLRVRSAGVCFLPLPQDCSLPPPASHSYDASLFLGGSCPVLRFPLLWVSRCLQYLGIR